MNKEVGKIYETDQYDAFKKLDNNRVVTYSKKLEKAAQDVGFLYQIIVNEKMEIIDGQHRLEVCKRLGIPVRYEVKDGSGDKEIISLNTTNKKWNLVDHIKHYAKNGNIEYIRLLGIIERYSGKSVILVTAMYGNSSYSNGSTNRIVQEGGFAFENYEKYSGFIEYLDKFCEKTKIKPKEKLLLALYKLYILRNFNGDRLIKKIFDTNQIEPLSLFNDTNKLLEILIIEVNNHKLNPNSKDYIEYTFSKDSKKELIILSDIYEWAKK